MASEHLISIILRALGGKSVESTMDRVKKKQEDIAKNFKTAQQQQRQAASGLSSLASRIGSFVPSGTPFAETAKNIAKIGSASLSSASALKPLGVGMGAVSASVAGIGIAVLGAAGALKLLQRGIEEAASQQTAINRLNIAFSSMGAYSEKAVRQVQSFANSMQLVTGFSDQAIMGTAALLAQLGRLSGEGLQRATRATLDLAVGLGRDLPVAALIMAKAAQGSTFELRKYGLVIDQNIPKTQRWQKALEFVETKFGGAAEAELRTFQGAVKQLGFAFQDLLEIVGSPVVIPLQEGIKDISKYILVFTTLASKIPGLDSIFKTPADLDWRKQSKDLDKFQKQFDKFLDTQAKLAPGPEAFTGNIFSKVADVLKLARAQYKEQALDMKTVTDELIERFDSLGSATQNIARRGDWTEIKASYDELWAIWREAIERKFEFEYAMKNDLTGFSDANEKQIFETLVKQANEAKDVYLDFVGVMGTRVRTNTDIAQASITDVATNIRKLSQTPQMEVTGEFDFDLKEVREQIEEAEKKFKDVFVKVPEPDLSKVKAAIKDALSSGDVDTILEAYRAALYPLKNIFREDLPTQPEAVKYARELLNVIESEFAEKAPNIIDFLLTQDTVKELQTGIKGFRQKIALKPEQIEIFKIDADKGNLEGLPAVLERYRGELEKLKGLDPKNMIDAYNSALGQIVKTAEGENRFTESGEKNYQMIMALARAMEELYTPQLERARHELFLLSRSEDLETQIRLNIRKEDFDQAEFLLNRLRVYASKMKEEHIELDLNIDSLAKQIDEGRDKMNEFQLMSERIFDNVVSSIYNSGLDAVGGFIASPFEEAVLGVEDANKRIEESFKRMIVEIIKELAKLAIIKGILGLFSGGSSTVFNGIGGNLWTGLPVWPTSKLRFSPPGTGPEQPGYPTEKPTAATPGAPGKDVTININAFDSMSIRRSLLTGTLGREMSRVAR